MKDINEKNYVIRHANLDDIYHIAKLHINCFKGFFLSALGVKLVAAYYNEFLNEVPDLFFVAEYSNEIIGFVMRYYKGNSFAKQKFIKHYKYKIILRIMIRIMFFDKIVIKRIWKLFKHNKSTMNNFEPNQGNLLSICILEKFRGCGLSSSLVSKFESALKVNGIESYTLSTTIDNYRAVNFYKKIGMDIYKKSNNDICFIKRI